MRAQNWLARLCVKAGWEHAESAGSGRNGTDVLNTPGYVWENKTAREFRPVEWTRQAAVHARDGDIPVTVYWPNGVGEESPHKALMILPLTTGLQMLAEREGFA